MHRARPVPPPGRVIVLGAGLAGAWAARELADLGCGVQVLDREGAPARAASGNPAGLFHGVVMADDGAHARALRAAALHAAQALPRWMRAGVPGRADGLLRLASAHESVEALQAQIDRHGLPMGYVQALDAAAASALVGIDLQRAAHWFPGGGWVDPGRLVTALLEGLPFRGGSAVERIEHTRGCWRLWDAESRVIAEADTLVLANAAEAARLAPWAGWPMGQSRGQISLWHGGAEGAPQPRVPLAGSGYLITRDDGQTLLAGATAQPGDDDAEVRDADHDFNRSRLRALCGWSAPAPDAGRVGWRAQVPDRLPLVGAVPAKGAKGALRLDQVTRAPGLFVLAALGSRGITWGPLAGRLLATQVCGLPWPLETALAHALDPARWQVRQARRA